MTPKLKTGPATVNLTPNHGALFTMFLRDAQTKALAVRHHPSRKTLHEYLLCLSIAADCMTQPKQILELREHLNQFLTLTAKSVKRGA